MKLILTIAAGIVLAFVLLTVGCGALIAVSEPATEGAIAEASKAASPAKVSGGDQAQGSAENYLSTAAFSRSGLINQLKFEGYSRADARRAVDSIDVDWNAQAAKSAENYLSTSSFSRSGLIEQLMYEGFTRAQATYGVAQVYG